jgi:hypothetical protein
MSNTTYTWPHTEPPKTPRELLELVALASLPTPTSVQWYDGILSLFFATVSDGQAWSRHLGGQTDTYVRDGHRCLDEGRIRWHGWSVQLHARDKVPPAEPAGDAR